MVKQQHQLFVALLVLVDAIVISAACLVAWSIRRSLVEGWWPESWEHTPKEALLLFAVPIVALSMRFFGLYRPRRDRSLTSETVQIFKASVAGMAALLAALYVFDSSIFEGAYGRVAVLGFSLDAGRVQLGSLTVVLPILLTAHRLGFRAALRYMRSRGWNQRHVAVIGIGRLAQITARTLERNSWTGLNVAYFISHLDQTRRQRCHDRPVLGGLKDLEQTIERSKPDAVFIALPSARSNLLPQILHRLERFPIDVRVVPDLNPRYLPHSMVVSELDGMPILSYRECPTSGISGVSKRIVDILGGAAALILFSPLMALIAILVRLSGPGPIIFKQRRVSLGGEVFNIYKFRTMYHVTDEAGRFSRPGAGRHAGRPDQSDRRAEPTTDWTERDDPRITPIGRWLRRTSLDELPQLFNVLVGDMSLVGPRPERPELIERFRDDWRGYMLRQHVKAGMTGWAQVNGLRGQTSLRKRLQYDLFYIRNWSLSFDFRILAMTVVRGFVHKNAH